MVMVVLAVVMVGLRLLEEAPSGQSGDPLVCPVCGNRLTQEGAECFTCKQRQEKDRQDVAKHPPPVKTDPKPDPKAGKAAPDRTKMIVVGFALCILMMVIFWPQIHRHIRSRQAEPEPNYRICHCPRCKRRLRYRAAMIGLQGKCPTCKDVFNFPVGEEDTGEDF